jgi:hypothetical protein
MYKGQSKPASQARSSCETRSLKRVYVCFTSVFTKQNINNLQCEYECITEFLTHCACALQWVGELLKLCSCETNGCHNGLHPYAYACIGKLIWKSLFDMHNWSQQILRGRRNRRETTGDLEPHASVTERLDTEPKRISIPHAK